VVPGAGETRGAIRLLVLEDGVIRANTQRIFGADELFSEDRSPRGGKARGGGERKQRDKTPEKVGRGEQA